MNVKTRPVDASALRFGFDPLREPDLPLLREWLLRPHVAQWWGPAESIETLREDFIVHSHEPGATRAYIARLHGRQLGFVQRYVVMACGGGWWPDELDPGARGIDQFLADPADVGHGLGRGMIRAFVARLFDDAAVTVVQTDPDPTNDRAVRCYRAAGFQAVGRVDTPDGVALLMRCTRRTLADANAGVA